jgi:mono/diheme cytochrome c family protein
MKRLVSTCFFRTSHRLAVNAGLFLFALLLSSCGGKYSPSEDSALRALQCPSSEKTYSYDEIEYNGGKGDGRVSFSDLKDSLNSACMGCHQAPANSGGFTYIDAYQGEVRTIGGKNQFYPGLFEIAEKVVEYTHYSDPKKRMPPEDRRGKRPETFWALGDQVQAWINAGKPNGSFSLDPNAPPPVPKKPSFRGSESGNCTPNPDIIGFDYFKDREFANLEKLPQSLADTDLFSLDAYELAKKGTVAYSVEYPLWADNNGKGRWIHFPMKIDGLKLVRQTAKYVEGKNFFEMPENTRLYKFFYKKIKMANGRLRYRRVETRIIVVRKPWNKSLFGTYKWDESEQSATLVETPYRDGTPFKDTVFQITVDELDKKVRDYAIPGSQRCIDCHMGSEGQNFVIGFSPLQLHRRAFGEAGREMPTVQNEVDQVERFRKYGLIENSPPEKEWPVLEAMGTSLARNEHELRASGYTVGNCAHCHNPNGLAFSKENGVNLQLTAGAIFGFNTKTRSTQIPTRLLVHQNGTLDESHIWRKISDTSQQLGLTSQMPMNTPGGPDCRALRLIGKWIRSFESDQAALDFEPKCKKENDFKWIDQDFTTVTSDTYVPRRPDWNDPQAGMPASFKNLELTPELQKAISEEIAVGYWNKKDICEFPNKDLPPEDRRPWMMKGDQPKKPYGEVYYTTPGSWYFRTSCMKCHGANADGNSSLARGIMQWSGGKVRVADLVHGMFGNKGENLKTFDADGKNYAAQYLFWMAMEGTRVQFPPELSSFLGKHGAQMLNQMREKCLNQISSNKSSTPIFMDHEIFSRVCFVNNLSKEDPALAFDSNTNRPLNPEKVEAWLDRAAFNVGYAIFYYLKDLSQGITHPGNDQCEMLYPKKENP